VRNLADLPEHRAVLEELRKAQREHALAIRDVGFLPESEMHRRAGRRTLYELGHDSNAYPIEKIVAVAEAASSLKPDALPQLKESLQDRDCAVRYWAAMGFLMRGAAAVESARAELRVALNDESPSVRIATARTLGQHGTDADLALALPVLGDLAPPDRNGVYVSLEALNAIDALGTKAAGLRAALRAMPRKDPSAVDRTAEYVPRLVGDLLGEGRSQPTPAANRPTPRRP